MKPDIQHSWKLSEQDALELQIQLSKKVIKEDQLNEVKLVAGVDVAYGKQEHSLVATIVVLDTNNLNIVEKITSSGYTQFPYISGLFSFRELPPLIEAFSKLSHTPDLVVCDGQGIAHPRRFGLACHFGVLFNIPTIGCGKTKLIGYHEEINSKRGSYSEITENGEVIGRALRTQNSIKPVYVSIGHKISLETASNFILRLSPRYRLPETTRMADQISRAAIRNTNPTLQ